MNKEKESVRFQVEFHYDSKDGKLTTVWPCVVVDTIAEANELMSNEKWKFDMFHVKQKEDTQLGMIGYEDITWELFSLEKLSKKYTI